MKLLPTRPRVLALGEPTHGEDVLLELRNGLFEQLVQQEGYRTIAIESDCLMGQVVDDYVAGGGGCIEDVLSSGFSHGFGDSAANRVLVRWMRGYNEGRPASQQLRFAGFDGPLEITGASSPRQALTALHSYLATWIGDDLLPCTADTLDQLIGAEDQWTNPAAMRDPHSSVGQTAEAARLQQFVGELVVVLEMQAPHLIAATSRADWDRAGLYGRTATGLLRYHFWMADSSPSRMAMLLGLRAWMMAANLLALAEQTPTLVFAHNSHLQRDKSSMRMGDLPVEWWSAGAIVSARRGKDYAFLATALGTIGRHGVSIPPPDTVEGLLYALRQDHCLVDPGPLAAAQPAPRVSSWYGYAPIDPAHLSSVDGVVFVKGTST